MRYLKYLSQRITKTKVLYSKERDLGVSFILGTHTFCSQPFILSGINADLTGVFVCLQI